MLIFLLFISKHPDYDVGPGFTPNDIALVRSTQMISGPNIAAGTLAASADNPGGTGFITGWGRTCGKSSGNVRQRRKSLIQYFHPVCCV